MNITKDGPGRFNPVISFRRVTSGKSSAEWVCWKITSVFSSMIFSIIPHASIDIPNSESGCYWDLHGGPLNLSVTIRPG